MHGIKFDTVFDFALIGILVGIIFARLYYVLFNLEYYIENPSEIFSIWNGGLAIYGGIIGGILAAIIFCKIKNIKLFDLCDYVVPFLAIRTSYWKMGEFY